MMQYPILKVIKDFLESNLRGLTIHTPVSGEELEKPYLLLSCSLDGERISRNNTWEITLNLALHTSAYDETGEEAIHHFEEACLLLKRRSTLRAINDRATSFFLYSLAARSVNEPEAQEHSFVQSMQFQSLAQF